MSKKTKNSQKIPSLLSGISGEYFVAAELSRQGYIASISLRNTRGIDILATKQNLKCSITIQVKTNQISKSYWVMHRKCEDFTPDSHFYIFVSLKGIKERPDFYIVPSKDVAKYTRKRHKEYMNELGKKGQKHKENSMRIFEDKDQKYLEKWELLGL